MRKRLSPERLQILLICVLLFGTAPSRALDIKIATLAPDGTLWMQEMRKGAEEIARRTDGRVAFKFYPGGSMGSDRSVLRKIRAGQLHGGMLTGGALSDTEDGYTRKVLNEKVRLQQALSSQTVARTPSPAAVLA